MASHPRDGHVNSTLMHGRTCPCACEGPVTLEGVPTGCQAEIIARMPALEGLPCATPREGGQARFACYREWAKDLGIHRIRVQPLACVRRLVEDRYGASRTGFRAGPNPCTCSTCSEEAGSDSEASRSDRDG